MFIVLCKINLFDCAYAEPENRISDSSDELETSNKISFAFQIIHLMENLTKFSLSGKNQFDKKK